MYLRTPSSVLKKSNICPITRRVSLKFKIYPKILGMSVKQDFCTPFTVRRGCCWFQYANSDTNEGVALLLISKGKNTPWMKVQPPGLCTFTFSKRREGETRTQCTCFWKKIKNCSGTRRFLPHSSYYWVRETSVIVGILNPPMPHGQASCKYITFRASILNSNT